MRPLLDLPLFGHASGDREAAFRHSSPPIAPQPGPYPPHGAGYRGPIGEPSEQAAKLVAGGAKAMRARVLREIRDAEIQGETAGLVADDIAARLGEHVRNVQPRISELFTMGLIRKGETRGRSALGASATRWLIKRGAV